MALRYTSERIETCTDNGNWEKVVVPLLTEIFEIMDENQDGSVDEVEGALVSTPPIPESYGYSSGIIMPRLELFVVAATFSFLYCCCSRVARWIRVTGMYHREGSNVSSAPFEYSETHVKRSQVGIAMGEEEDRAVSSFAAMCQAKTCHSIP